MYRGLPCIYSSGILSSASLLSGGNMALLRVIAVAMILFMISHNFYPHDRVLESQAWKKVVYAGGDVPSSTGGRIQPCFTSHVLQSSIRDIEYTVPYSMLTIPHVVEKDCVSSHLVLC